MIGSPDLVQASSPADGVRLITLNRPEKRNAMSTQVLGQLLPELASASRDPSVRAIVVTGAGSFFSAGADLKDIAALDAAGARSCRYLEDLCIAMSSVHKPILAAVNGPALGGGFELALMCDLIFASKSAYFALPEVQRGLIPGAGGTQRLTASLGKFIAMRTILLGKQITSDEALRYGLVCDQFDDVVAGTIQAAAQLAALGPEAMSLAKDAVCRADNLCRDDEYERNLYYTTFGTAEKRKGIDEFLEKKSAKN